MSDLPQDTDAEIQVLGAAMHSSSAVDDCANLKPEDFYRPTHEHLWRVIQRQHLANKPTDMVAITDALRRDPVRGLDASALASIYAQCVTAANANYYAEIIALKARQRRMAQVGNRITQLALAADTTTADLDSVTEAARRELDTADRPDDGLGFLGDRIDDTLDALEKPAPSVPTPWASFNNLIGGWAPGRLYVVGARPGVGKSVVGIEAALRMAQTGKAAAIVSLEMSKRDVDKRIIANLAEVPFNRLEKQQLESRDWDKIAAAHSDLATLPLAVHDGTDLSLHQIRAWLRAVARRRELGIVVVDYLQLITGSPKVPRHELVGGFSRSLKLLAKELDVPVVALSQLNRASEQRQDKTPSLSDLRESGAVEQDADVVILLHRNLENVNALDRLGAVVAKNRHGMTDGFQMEFQGHYMRLAEKAWTPHRAAIAS